MKRLILLCLGATSAWTASFSWQSSRVELPVTGSNFVMTGKLTGQSAGLYRFTLTLNPLVQNLVMKINNNPVASGAFAQVSNNPVNLLLSGTLSSIVAVNQPVWLEVKVQSVLGQTIGIESFYVKKWNASNGPMPGEIHTVNMAPAAIKGGATGDAPMLVVQLDGPAPAGGQKVLISSSDLGLAKPKSGGSFIFTIPHGENIGVHKDFLQTKNTALNREVQIRASVNGRQGVVNLKILK